MRIMAIDYGDARPGIAISDATGLLAGFTTVIHSRKSEVVAEEIEKLTAAHGVEELVMGFPRNMDGTEGPRAELYRAFAGQLEARTGLTPCSGTSGAPPWRPTASSTPAAEKMKQHKKTVDAVAATLILEGYLTLRRNRS